jgi:hypothetical protein
MRIEIPDIHIYILYKAVRRYWFPGPGCDARQLTIPSKYQENGYKPAFDELPLEADYWAVQEKAKSSEAQRPKEIAARATVS